MIRRLIQKELQLQRSNFFLALGAVFLWGILYVSASWARMPLTTQTTFGALIQAFYYFLLLPILWILLPLTIGASIVAGERTLGVLDWAFALPASRSRQWIVKAAVAVILSFLLGAM